MTENKLKLEEVRQALGQTMNSRGFRIFSPEARAQALEYAHERLQAGAKVSEVSSELGLIGWTLQRWLQRERSDTADATPGFVKLEVKQDVQQQPVLRGACGVWVEGLGVEEIAAVLRSLSCSA